MNAQKLQTKLQWWKITGHSVDDKALPVVAFVEATSRKKVLRYHGGQRKQTLANGNVMVLFTTDQTEVELLGKKLKPERLKAESDAIIAVMPATRYLCECGREHVSEHPYPSVWCSCGKKARPVHTE